MKRDIFRAAGAAPARPHNTAFWFGALVVMAGFGLGAADASARQPTFERTPDTIELPAHELRRSELRRALISTHEVGEAAPVRRRLSDEERSALHRDLRDAMRGAYQDTPRSRKGR